MVVKRETGKESSLYNSNDRDQYHNISCPSFKEWQKMEFSCFITGQCMYPACLRMGILSPVYKYVSTLWIWAFDEQYVHIGCDRWNLELEIGKWKYLAVYLLSGLMGNLLSTWMDIQTGEYAISAGASGANLWGDWGIILCSASKQRTNWKHQQQRTCSYGSM